MFHAGHSPDLRHSSLKESCHLSALGIQIFGKSDTHREHLIRPKAWINANKAYEAVQQQTSPYQQHQRKSDLRNDETVAQPLPGQAGRPLAFLLQCRLKIDLRVA